MLRAFRSALASWGCAVPAAGLGLAVGFAPAAAQEPPEAVKGPVAARVVKVRDGDTIEVEAFIWPMQSVHVAVRLRGIDAPELRGRCATEKYLAARARDRLAKLVATGEVRLSDVEGDKYFGRVLATVSTAGEPDLGGRMLRDRLAAPYGGKTRPDWCGAGIDFDAVGGIRR